ncbi:MAG: hypothetical protein ACP5LV_05940 [Thermoplasmata archaeon]
MFRYIYMIAYLHIGGLMVAPDQDVWTSVGYVAAQNLTTNDWILNANTGS